MNEAIAFDTHRFVKNLTESGFTEQQAEALAKEQVQLLNSNLATKVDILALKADIETVKAVVEKVKAGVETVKAELEAKLEAVKLGLQADIQTVKADLEAVKLGLQADIQASKVVLLKWMVTAMIAQGTLIVALVVAFVKLL